MWVHLGTNQTREAHSIDSSTTAENGAVTATVDTQVADELHPFTRVNEAGGWCDDASRCRDWEAAIGTEGQLGED